MKDGALSWCHLICDGIKQALFCLLDTDQRSGDGQGIGNGTRENPKAVGGVGDGFSSRPTSVSMLPSSLSSWERRKPKAALPAAEPVLAALLRRGWGAGL